MPKSQIPDGRFPRINIIVGGDFANPMEGRGTQEELFTLHLDIHMSTGDADVLKGLLGEKPVPLKKVREFLEPRLRGTSEKAARCREMVEAAFGRAGPLVAKSRRPFGRWPRVNYLVLEDRAGRMESPSPEEGSLENFLRLHLDIPLRSGTGKTLREHLRNTPEDRRQALAILEKIMDRKASPGDSRVVRGRGMVRAALRPWTASQRSRSYRKPK